MKIDVLIEYDPKLSELTVSSKAAQFNETRTARIGLSRPKNEDISSEQCEFVGESWEVIKKIENYFPTDPTRKDKILRIVNPFESATFEPRLLFHMIKHFSMYILITLYPKTHFWRMFVPFLDRYEITLKIPGYNLFNAQKKAEFEKLLRAKYKHTTFDS